MTTIKDYLRDLVLETQKKLQEEGEFNADKVLTPLTEHEIDDLVDETVEIIKERIVG